MIEDRLMGCPFCGGEVEIASVSVAQAMALIRASFECKKCGASIKLKADFTGDPHGPIGELEKAWNRRAEDGK